MAKTPERKPTPAKPSAQPKPDRSKWLDPYDDRQLVNYFSMVRKAHGSIQFLSLPQYRKFEDVGIGRLFVDHLFERLLGAEDHVAELRVEERLERRTHAFLLDL